MSSAAQVLRQADALKASISDSSKGLSETWVVRQRLEDLYKKLLLMDLEYALDKKVEQDLWNHAFKNHINNLQTQTKDKQNLKRGETQATLNLFLETASGFYLQLLQLICTSFKLDLPFRRKSSCYGVMKEKVPLKVKIIPPKKSSCLYVCQYCLVHLGDIARYRQQIEQSQTYYWHAANLVPSNGQPYNQLAIVEAARGNKLSTVFYYIRSLAVRHPFPAAATNLEKLYTKLAKDKHEFKGKLSVNEMITAFLQFQAYTHICTELERASMLSSKLLAALPAHVTSQSFPSHILVQIIAINIFAMHHSLRQLHDTEDKSPNAVSHEDLSSDEQQAFSQMFNFTMSVLDVLLQYTPKQEQKLKEFFTLPAVKLLLDWFKLNPSHLENPTLKSASLWGNLSKVLNNIKLPTSSKDGDIDITKYEDLPLPEDTELRCFQFLEKAHSGYSYSRLPSEGLSVEVETLLRCKRLLMHGKWIAEEHPSKNILTVKTDKSGRLQFTAPSVQVKVKSGDESQVPTPEKKSSRQNVAIQAIIQKKNQQQTSSAERGTPTKIQERVKPAPVSSDSSLIKSLAPDSVGPSSPKYLLGVPTSEPVFMKSGSTRPQGQGSTRVPIQQQPPRLQKQLLAQQQASQNSSGGQQPSLWQENSPPAPHTGQLQSPAQGQHQQPQAKQQSQKLLWPQSLQQQQQQQDIKLQQQQQQQQQNAPKSQPPPQPHQSTSSQGLQQHSPPQQPGHVQEGGQMSSGAQSQQIPPPPLPYMMMPPDFRMPSKFPNMSQPPPGMGQSQMMGFNARPGPGQNHIGMQGNAGLNSLFRFPPPMGNNSSQSPRIPFDRPPPSLPQQQPESEASSEVMQENHEMKKPQHMRGSNSGLAYPGYMPNQSYGSQSGNNSQTQHKNIPQPPKQQQTTQGVPNFGNKFGNQAFGGQSNTQYPPGNQGMGQFPGGQGNSNFQGNQMNNSYPGGQGSNQFPGKQPSNQGNRAQYLANQHNFQPAPGTDRLQVGGIKQQPGQQGAPPQMQNGSYQSPMMNPMTSMPPGVGRINLRHPAFAGPIDQTMLKKEDLPMDILGALAQLAVQPPKSTPDNFLMPNRMGATFQGHAEGTPKPDTGSSPNRSPLPAAEPEPRTINRTSASTMQQGTYSLFSGSPWSVPLSTADSKSMGSSPFSSESNSIRNSPDPGADNSETKIGSALDLGLRFGQNEDHWREKGHPVPNQEQMPNPGPGPYFPGPLQAIWSSPGPSPLERLLEMQKQQRQTDPH